MQKIFIVILIMTLFTTKSQALSPWLKNLENANKQQQIDLRWKAYGGQADLKLMHEKLADMNIQIFPRPEFSNKHWDLNSRVFPVSEKSQLELQMPYGNIEKITAGHLSVNSNFTLSSGKLSVKVDSFDLVPVEKGSNASDIVNFQLIDQDKNHLFTITSVHIEYDKERGLLRMSNMDLFATAKLAELLNIPALEGQVIGQLHTYSRLFIPEFAETELRGSDCNNHPIWPPAADVDVQLVNIGTVQWMRNIGSDKIIVAPSASLKNVGSADVAWYQQFTGPFDPYGNDQHPFLNWSIYREIDNRFEQLAYSGIKHAFLTINSNCDINCNNSHILWLGCEDVYGTGNNDSSYDLGPRAEIESFAGSWDNCGSFFDPQCTGSHQNSSNATDENRLSVYTSDLSDANTTQMYFQAWYLIRDDVNIFNSMGYRTIAPVQSGNIWLMNMGNTFSNGAALDNYVPANSATAMQSSKTIDTKEGLVTAAVKVVDLGGGLYRYNYAVENYEFDARFNKYQIVLDDSAQFINPVFADPDHDVNNDWQFVRNNNVLSIAGTNQNEQDWGMLFSFSFTTDRAPATAEIKLSAAEVPAVARNSTIVVPILIPDIVFKAGFEN